MISKLNNYLFKPSLFIITFPFLILLLIETNELVFIYYSLIFLILDFLFFYKIRESYTVYIIFFINFILYTQFLFNDSKFTLHDLRLRYFTFIYFILLFILVIIIKKLKISFKFHNTFVMFFSFTLLLNNYMSSQKIFNRSNFLSDLNYSYLKKNINDENKISPVILIVLDEFSSTDEIFKYTKDSIDIDIDNFFLDKNYTVKPSFRSKTLRTALSLPSIFNFNFHNGVNNDSIENIDKGLQKIPGFEKLLRDNLLVDSLNIKGIKSYSYGIAPFKKGINSDSFYYYWDNRNPNQNNISKIIDKTIIGTYLNNRKRKFKHFDEFRKETLSALKFEKFESNSFYYFHLYFPHDPFSYFDEYPAKNLNYYTIDEKQYLDEHIAYKRWFVKKFKSILEMKKFNDARVIITGDHGFRFNNSIEPSLTSGYFKGYSKNSTDQINSVQDIGYLIFESF